MKLFIRISFRILFMLYMSIATPAFSAVVLNEVMSANDTTLYDEDGETPDWIELYNATDSSWTLAGFGLSDDPVSPFKWIFPAIRLEPQQLLVVYASDKNRTNPIGALHTNFKIKSSGESLLLTAPHGQLVDRIDVPELKKDQSYGRLPDGSGAPVLLSKATPSVLNQSVTVVEVTAAPLFSHLPGFYDESISISLTVDDPQAQIYYSLDGSEPDKETELYRAAIRLDTTAVIRARAFLSGAQPSDIVTSTFILDDAFPFPVISLTTDPYNLWDEHDGIYVKGPNARDVYPYKGANFWREWERPIHVEFFEDKNLVLAENAGVRIFGHYSVAAPFKPLAIYAREKYGAGKFNYQIFPNKDIADFEVFMLRNSGNDWHRTLFRDALMHRLANEIGLPTQAYRPAIVFLNGVYWGIHNLRERMNEHYVASNFNVHADNIDLLAWNYGFQIYAGDTLNYCMFRDYILNTDLTNPENYRHVRNKMFIDNYIDYFATEIYCNNRDWPGNNQYMWRPKEADGRWMWMIKDMDHGFGYESPYWNNTLYRNAIKDELFAKLLQNATFRNRFINRFAFLMSTTFAPDHVKKIIKEMQSRLEPEMKRHLTRWAGAEDYGDPPETVDEWRAYCDKLVEFADNRLPHVKQHLTDRFDLDKMVNVTIDAESKYGGQLLLEDAIIDEYPWTGAFFSNMPLRIKAEARAGYHFVGWNGAETKSDSLIIFPASDMTLTANFKPVCEKERHVVINEINYFSTAHFNVEDWFELTNMMDEELDLSDWVFRDSEEKHRFVFPRGTKIAPKGFLVITRHLNSFRGFFPHISNVIGNFEFGLSSSGDGLYIFDNYGTLVDSVTYTSKEPWPVRAYGRGATLALIFPGADNSDPANWFASSPHGTPGCANIQRRDIAANDNFVISNYPNPFNGPTVFRLKLPFEQYIKIDIYNVRGQFIETLVSDVLSAGNHSIEWRPADAPSGLYFCRIRMHDQTIIHKVMLQK